MKKTSKSRWFRNPPDFRSRELPVRHIFLAFKFQEIRRSAPTRSPACSPDTNLSSLSPPWAATLCSLSSSRAIPSSRCMLHSSRCMPPSSRLIPSSKCMHPPPRATLPSRPTHRPRLRGKCHSSSSWLLAIDATSVLCLSVFLLSPRVAPSTPARRFLLRSILEAEGVYYSRQRARESPSRSRTRTPPES